MDKNIEVYKISMSVILGFFAELYNKYSVMLIFMSVAIIFDVITELIKTKCKGEKPSSKIGTKGFFKKLMFFIAYFFGVFLDLFVPYAINTTGIEGNISTFFGLIIGAYITLNECISICENFYEINEDIFPKWIADLIRNMKNKIDKKGE